MSYRPLADEIRPQSLDEVVDWARKSAGSFGRESAPTRSRPQSR